MYTLPTPRDSTIASRRRRRCVLGITLLRPVTQGPESGASKLTQTFWRQFFVPCVSGLKETCCSRICGRRHSILGHVYVVCVKQRQLTRLFVWQSTRVQVADQTTDQHGDVRDDREVIRDKPGSASWKSTSGSLSTPLGALPAIVKSGRYDPMLVKRSSE